MSHRVTVQTEIKDRNLAIAALNAKGVQFREANGRIHMTSGDYQGAELNLTTGELRSGDVDHFRVDEAKMGLLRQAYAEQKYKAEAFKEGISIESSHVDAKGVIRMKCRSA